MPSSDISLYIHIPFCSQKCHYCDFYSLSRWDDDLQLSVVKEILAQFNWYMGKLSFPEIDTVFIGGGTPSVLSSEALILLLMGIRQKAGDIREFSIESNPESLSKDFLRICSENGVNRLSLGVQTTSDSLLKVIGRKAGSEDIQRALDLIKSEWKGRFNMDIISSLPGQDLKQIDEDLNLAINSGVDHISFYSLMVEEGTKLEERISQGELEDLDEDTHEALWSRGREILEKKGFHCYEVSNFAKEGCECQHNLRYWHLSPYIGCGPGAVSTCVIDGKIQRVSCKKSVKGFLAGEEALWGMEFEPVESHEFLTDYIMMGLRLKEGLDVKTFQKIFSAVPGDVITNTSELLKQGLICCDDDFYSLSDRGFRIMNQILVSILDHIEWEERPLNWG